MLINLYATLRKIAGGKTLEVEFVEGVTLRRLLQDLIIRFPQLRKELTGENGDLPGHVLVFLNGRDQSFLPNKLDTELKADDVVGIFPPVGGG